MNFNEMKKQIKGLSTDDAKSLLLDSFYQIQLLNESNISEDEFIQAMKHTYNFTTPRKSLPKEQIHAVHIIFGKAAAGSLKFMLRTTNKAKHEKAITFPDIYSIGPIEQLHMENGIINRIEWLKNLQHYENTLHNQYDELIEQIAQIPIESTVYIWTADNAHDQTGLLYALYLLRHSQNKIVIIDAEQTFRQLYETDKTTYGYLSVSMMSEDRLYRIYEQNKRNKPLTNDLHEQYNQQWLTLSENPHPLRIWENKQIVSVNEDYIDEFIIQKANEFRPEQFIKSARLIGEVIGHLEQQITDDFIDYRMRQLITNGTFDVQGYPPYYDVRLKSNE